ncbi:MAG: hypothetical protein JSW66_07615 [Phycisphaerales bacterium]|nr:MAG: hypothetical protein JSW66_07615 [Phycisphaerales bacterium]
MKKKEWILAMLFFGSLWGVSEALLGGVLYRASVPYASVPLSIIGFVVLTFAWVYFPRAGTGIVVGACAMLFKFLNTPFFACHLLGILLMGGCYDLFLGVFKIRSRWLSALAATYLGYALFALMITYVFGYAPWVEGGFGKVVGHIGIGGSLAALANAILVPLSFRAGERLKSRLASPFAPRFQWTAGVVSATTFVLWLMVTATYLLGSSPVR